MWGLPVDVCVRGQETAFFASHHRSKLFHDEKNKFTRLPNSTPLYKPNSEFDHEQDDPWIFISN